MLYHTLQSGPKAEFVHLTDDGSLATDSAFAVSLRTFDQQKSTATHAKRLLAYIEIAATLGLEALSVEQCREANKNEKIYEFRAGSLRLLFFKASTGKLVVCSHIFVKKSQKAPPQEIGQAVRLKNQFEKAISSKKLKRGAND